MKYVYKVFRIDIFIGKFIWGSYLGLLFLSKCGFNYMFLVFVCFGIRVVVLGCWRVMIFVFICLLVLNGWVKFSV